MAGQKACEYETRKLYGRKGGGGVFSVLYGHRSKSKANIEDHGMSISQFIWLSAVIRPFLIQGASLGRYPTPSVIMLYLSPLIIILYNIQATPATRSLISNSDGLLSLLTTIASTLPV